MNDKDPADLARSVPKDYLDGCTLFPDRFGTVSHKHICIEHDIEYWLNRTLVGKVKADWDWMIGINRTHRKNKLWWKAFALASTTSGFIVLSTVGWIFWFNKNSWTK